MNEGKKGPKSKKSKPKREPKKSRKTDVAKEKAQGESLDEPAKRNKYHGINPRAWFYKPPPIRIVTNVS